MPSDEPIRNNKINILIFVYDKKFVNRLILKATIIVKPDQFVELKSPYVGYKSSSSIPLAPTARANSRYSRIRSRPQSEQNIQGIDEADELNNSDHHKTADSPNELNRAKLDANNEVTFVFLIKIILFFKNILSCIDRTQIID